MNVSIAVVGLTGGIISAGRVDSVDAAREIAALLGTTGVVVMPASVDSERTERHIPVGRIREIRIRELR